MAEDLAGRVALVTGSGRRLGRSIALALAGQGMRLALHYRSSRDETLALAREIEGTGGGAAAGARAACFAADLARGDAARALPGEVHARMGRLDLVVNSASIFRRTPVAAIDERAIDDMLAIHFKAPFLIALAAAPLLAPGGSIVNIADASVWTPWPDYVAYQASKAALVALTEYLARALAPGVRVNSVCPGPILMPEGAAPGDEARAIARVPLGRLGAPADVAEAVVFLARSPYLTGVLLPVDGGRRLG